jgi:hypothetical protein
VLPAKRAKRAKRANRLISGIWQSLSLTAITA